MYDTQSGSRTAVSVRLEIFSILLLGISRVFSRLVIAECTNQALCASQGLRKRPSESQTAVKQSTTLSSTTSGCYYPKPKSVWNHSVSFCLQGTIRPQPLCNRCMVPYRFPRSAKPFSLYTPAAGRSEGGGRRARDTERDRESERR